MKKRVLEVVAVVAVVAAVAAWSGRDRELPWGQSDLALTSTATPGVAILSTPSLLSHSHASEEQKLWQALYAEGQAALNQGDNPKALSQFASALALAKDAGPDALHQTLDGLALVSYRMGNYAESARYQDQAIKAVLTLPPTQSLPLLGLYESRRAQLLQAVGETSEAIKALERARQAYVEVYPEGTPPYDDAMNALAEQHRAIGDNEGADRLLEG